MFQGFGLKVGGRTARVPILTISLIEGFPLVKTGDGAGGEGERRSFMARASLPAACTHG